MRTRAMRSGDDWIINGTKMWITNGSVADVAVVWARTDEGVRGFAVPTDAPGFTAHTITSKLSLRASVTSELVLDDVRLPDSARLPGATSLGAPLKCLNEARFGIVFGALGAARDCLESALGYARFRTQFGKPIGEFQLTQQKLADMTLEVREALTIARTARTILGASGITSEYPVMRHANNLESVLTYEGTSEMHTLIIGEALTGAAAFR
jgi:glutaryl-CoA dehydrogenase